MSSQHFDNAINVGHQTLLAASKVRNSLFPSWRQRTFRRHLGRFIVALERIPQMEAEVLDGARIGSLNELIDALVDQAEAFMADRHDATTAEIEQDRFVITEIYQLRAIAETLTRRVTADPGVMDVSWTVRTQSGNQPKP